MVQCVGVTIPRGGTIRFGKRILTVAALGFLAACAAKKEAMPPPTDGVREAIRPPAARVEVVRCDLAANREFVGVRFRITGPERYDPAGMEAYLIDEATGERYQVVRLERIGRLAEFPDPAEKDVHHVLFRNQEGKLKAGSYVTVVVGPARQEHVLLRE